ENTVYSSPAETLPELVSLRREVADKGRELIQRPSRGQTAPPQFGGHCSQADVEAPRRVKGVRLYALAPSHREVGPITQSRRGRLLLRSPVSASRQRDVLRPRRPAELSVRPHGKMEDKRS